MGRYQELVFVQRPKKSKLLFALTLAFKLMHIFLRLLLDLLINCRLRRSFEL